MPEQQESEQDQSLSDQAAHASHHDISHSYLLRLWRSGGEGNWRASLQAVRTGERHTFADLDSLLAFLCEQLGTDSP